MNIPVDSIRVKRRVRSDAGDIRSLVESIKRYGLLHPILINEKNELIAGERRLRAVQELGWHMVPVNVIHGAGDVSELEMEIEENVQRADFTEDDLLKAYMRLNRLKNPGPFRRQLRYIADFFRRLFRRIRLFFKHLAQKNKKRKRP